MSKMKVQDATKELSRRAAKLLGDVTGVRTAAEKTLAELRKIENGFTQQQEAEREEKRREEQQKALSSQSKGPQRRDSDERAFFCIVRRDAAWFAFCAIHT